MPFDDLRAFLGRLEDEGELLHVTKEVDWNEEVGAIVRRTDEHGLPAVMFDNVKGYPKWRIAAEVASSTRRVSMSMDMPPDTPAKTLVSEYLRRTKEPIKPVLVDTGPCKENILLGDQIDLFALPAPFIHAGDGGRYLCTWHVTIMKDPDSDWVNWGMYRGMVLDKKKLGVLMQTSQHAGILFYRKYEPRNQPMDVAVAIGVEPMSTFCAQTFFPPMVSEVDMVGAMRGKPVELVRCETVDLQVPATAEIVIEGKVYPGERLEEGPFGEYTGYRAADREPRTFMEVTAITHRNDPILTMSCTGLPLVNDCHIPMAITRSAEVERELKSKGFPVTGVWFYSQSSSDLAVVATKVPFANVASAIAHVVFGTRAGFTLPFLIVVEDDVDPSSWPQVMHALATRCHPYRGVRRLEYETSNILDPRLSLSERRLALGSKAYFDCTWPIDWDREEVPQLISFATAYSKETQEKVLHNWSAYGLPEVRP